MTKPWEPERNDESVAYFDFSKFHPSDHWPFTARCRKLPGGGFWHLQVAWRFHRREQVLRPVWRLFLCPLGRHHEFIQHSLRSDGTRGSWVGCLACKWTRVPSEWELERFPVPRFHFKKED